MISLFQRVAGALIVLVAAMTPAFSGETQTKVRVALLDVSALMPSGFTGYGMMGPAPLGQGQNVPNYGMMGPGMMGYGMMGPGMMVGQGMMGGMMAIRVDQPTVKAGSVAFEVTNWSRSVLHEMIVISVDGPAAPLPYDYPQARVPEEQVKVLGEAADLQPNSSKTLELTLSPGSYLLVCNVPSHYAAGMVTALNVTP